jgi:hypothetical protein
MFRTVEIRSNVHPLKAAHVTPRPFAKSRRNGHPQNQRPRKGRPPAYGTELVTNFFGDLDNTIGTLVTNLSALSLNPFAVGAAALWDLQAAGRAGITCSQR